MPQGWTVGNVSSDHFGIVVVDVFKFVHTVNTGDPAIGLPQAFRGQSTAFDYSATQGVTQIFPELVIIGNSRPFFEDITGFRPVITLLNPAAMTFSITWQQNTNTPAGSFWSNIVSPLGYICYVKGI